MARPFGKKRQIKISRVIQLIFVVSFFTLTSCGIPNPFYLPRNNGTSTSYYFDTITPSTRTLKLNYKISGSDYILDTNEIVPSLVFLYVIVPNDYDGYSTSISTDDLVTTFSLLFDNYYVNNVNGKSISSITDEVLIYKSSSINYKFILRKFSVFENSSNIKLLNLQNHNNYGLTFNKANILKINDPQSCTLTLNQSITDGNNFDIILNQNNKTFIASDVASDSSISDNIYLKTYQKTDFLGYNSTSNKSYKVLLFSALTVSATNYTNIFWSDLMYLGYVDSSITN